MRCEDLASAPLARVLVRKVGRPWKLAFSEELPLAGGLQQCGQGRRRARSTGKVVYTNK